MAQTNFTPILTYKSDTASAVPSAGNLTNSANGAELAVNTADKRLFTKDSGGNVVELGTNPSSLTLPNSTANGVVYANGSKVLTTGSALTFDGTALAPDGTVRTLGTTALRWGTVYATAFADGTDQLVGSSGAQARFGYGPSWTSQAFAISGSEQMRLTSTGLGIGTSSPAQKLEVANTSGSVAATLRSSNSGYSELYFADVADNAAGAISYEHSSNIMRLYNGGSARVYLDSSGNLGLGVTPSAWASGKAIELAGTGLRASLFQSDSGVLSLAQNYYFNGGADIYAANGFATRYYQLNGQHVWNTAPSGTAGDAISFSQVMTLDANGSLVVGGTTVVTNNGGITATTTSSGSVASTLAMRNAGTANGSGTTLAFRGVTNAGAEADYAYLSMVADDTTAKTGSIRFSTVAGSSPVERARIDSSGTFILKGTATGNQQQFWMGGSEQARIGINASNGLDFAVGSTTPSMTIDSSGNFIQSAPSTAPSLATNGTMVFNLTSNTNLRVSVRGSDGVTRTANITLA